MVGTRLGPALLIWTAIRAEQAYRRSDALEKRRKLMEAWGVLLFWPGQRRSIDERGRCASLSPPARLPNS
jgi:hypothetical protein